jgi:hypothetical protein
MLSFIISTRYEVLSECSNKKRMKWAGHVASMGDRKCAYKVLVRKPNGKSPLGGRIILKRIFKTLVGGAWTEFIWLRIGTSVGFLERGNEHSGSIKCGEFLDWPTD